MMRITLDLPVDTSVVTFYKKTIVRFRYLCDPLNSFYVTEDFDINKPFKLKSSHTKNKLTRYLAFSMMKYYFIDHILPQMRNKMMDYSNVHLFAIFLKTMHSYNPEWKVINWLILFKEYHSLKKIEIDCYPDADRPKYKLNIDKMIDECKDILSN